MKWITRERPKIDRIAREQDATPCDIPGVKLSHVGKDETHNWPTRMQAMRERWPAGRCRPR
jgi:hypothetical protein